MRRRSVHHEQYPQHQNQLLSPLQHVILKLLQAIPLLVCLLPQGGRSDVLALSTNNQYTTNMDRIALVTGANKGIGREIAKLLAAHNNDSKNDEPNKASRIIPILACRTDGFQTAQALGVEHWVYLDLTNETSIEACAAYIEKTFGRLDILINNAAICFNDPTLYGKVPYTPFQQQANTAVETNYFGTKRVCQAMMPLLLKGLQQQLRQQQEEENSENGNDSNNNKKNSVFFPPRIINIASAAGRLGILRSPEKVQFFTNPHLTARQLDRSMKDFCHAVETGVHATQGWPNTCYGMSKLGLIAYTKILAREYGADDADSTTASSPSASFSTLSATKKPLILVNSVDPGYCATDQNNNQGTRPAARGARTPYLLATTTTTFASGYHWFDEQKIAW
jgi:carbonyl reductase 1